MATIGFPLDMNVLPRTILDKIDGTAEVDECIRYTGMVDFNYEANVSGGVYAIPVAKFYTCV